MSKNYGRPMIVIFKDPDLGREAVAVLRGGKYWTLRSPELGAKDFPEYADLEDYANDHGFEVSESEGVRT